jgi:adenine-specific DNA-methyltransferase
LKNYIADKKTTADILDINKVINKTTICDPAVGSGHFLVSALNEMISIKHDLGILCDEKGVRIAGYDIGIENDELIVTHQNGDVFQYIMANGKPISKEDQRLQRTLFHEKQAIIENSLFGVDINPNSVKICRLRLWIELLKNAYYKEDTAYQELETLPNIDINIKCGNSLISRFRLDEDLSKVLKSIKYDIKTYRGFVQEYKNCKDREAKQGLELIIDNIKGDFRTEIGKNDPKQVKLKSLSGELFNLLNQTVLIDDDKTKKAREDKKIKLGLEVNKLASQIEDIKSNAIYRDAFEWRFEFPEVLNDNGDFVGFDLVIGNPPYGAKLLNRDVLKELFPLSSLGQLDTYKFFIDLLYRIVKDNGIGTFITSDSYLEKKYFADVRSLMVNKSSFIRNIKLGDNIFEEINLPTAILEITKQNNDDIKFEFGDISLYTSEKKSNLVNSGLQFSNSIPRWEDGFIVKTSIINKSKFTNLIELYDQVMGVKVYQIGKGKPKQTNLQIDNNVFISKNKLDNTYYPFISKGIGRYIYQSKDEWISYGEWLAEPRKEKYFKDPKIVIREIVNPRIFATFIEEHAVVKNIAAVIIPRSDKFTLKYLLALLNSNLFTYYLFEQTPKSSNKSYPSFTSDIIKNLPIKEISLEEQMVFISLVDQIIALKKEEKDTTALEQEIDKMVYELYGLTAAEIEVVEGKK